MSQLRLNGTREAADVRDRYRWEDRDINAAKNILAAGLAVTACGGTVRRTGDTPGAGPSETGNPGGAPRESPSLRAGEDVNGTSAPRRGRHRW